MSLDKFLPTIAVKWGSVGSQDRSSVDLLTVEAGYAALSKYSFGPILPVPARSYPQYIEVLVLGPAAVRSFLWSLL